MCVARIVYVHDIYIYIYIHICIQYHIVRGFPYVMTVKSKVGQLYVAELCIRFARKNGCYGRRYCVTQTAKRFLGC